MFQIYSIGNPGDLTYKYNIIGDKTDIKNIVFNKSEFSKKLLSAKKPLVIIGESALELKVESLFFEISLLKKK